MKWILSKNVISVFRKNVDVLRHLVFQYTQITLTLSCQFNCFKLLKKAVIKLDCMLTFVVASINFNVIGELLYAVKP